MAGPFTSAAGDFASAAASLFAGKAAQSKAAMYKVEAQADLLKGEGAKIEGENYAKAQALALTNEEYAKTSTAIQEAQASRAIYLQTGEARAAAGASGIAQSGSALDILADSARQGELQKQVLAQQGLITEAGYQEQAETYGNMVKASDIAVKGAQLASQEHLMAADAEETAAKGSFITGAIKAAAGVAAIVAAPYTGGLSLTALGALGSFGGSEGSAAP